MEAASEPLLVPDSVFGEVAYFLGRYLSPFIEARAFTSLTQEPLSVVHLRTDDILRACELVRQYADNPIGFVDASIVALAERLRINQVLTLDVRHFAAIRPRHVPALTLLPG
ncbi:MAG: PIN domain-containing protein [Dehalococcoidia bacterium]